MSYSDGGDTFKQGGFRGSPADVPQRTCVACRQTKPKWGLVRLVHTPKGDIEIDHRGKKAGRGAYLCPARECWELALIKDRRNRLARALRTVLTEEYRTALLEYSKTLPVRERN